MRCIKCGYTSFDYLAECSKCGTSLEGARDSLGFTAAKPAVPFLVQSLIKGGTVSAEQAGAPEKASASSSFEFEEEFGGGFQIVQEEEPQKAAEAAPNPDEGEEDFSLLDLSDEELELLIDKKPGGEPEKQPDFWLESDTAKGVPGIGTSPAAAPDAFGQMQDIGGKKAESGLIPNFDVGSLPGLAAKAPASGIEFEMPAPGPEAGLKPAAQAPAAEPQHQELGDDFLVELSEDDLETLLKDLDGKKPETEKPKTEAPPAPKSE